MKKILAILLAAMMLFSIVACTNNDNNNENPDDGKDPVVNPDEGEQNPANPDEGEQNPANPDEGEQNPANPDEGEQNPANPDEGEQNPANPDEGETPVANPELNILNTIWNALPEDNKFFAMGGGASNIVDGAPGAYPLTEEGAAEGLEALAHLPAAEFAKIDGAATLLNGMNANMFTSAAFHLVNGADSTAVADAIKNHLLNKEWMCGFPEKFVIATSGDCIIVMVGLNDFINPVLDTAKTNVEGLNIVVEHAFDMGEDW